MYLLFWSVKSVVYGCAYINVLSKRWRRRRRRQHDAHTFVGRRWVFRDVADTSHVTYGLFEITNTSVFERYWRFVERKRNRAQRNKKNTIGNEKTNALRYGGHERTSERTGFDTFGSVAPKVNRVYRNSKCYIYINQIPVLAGDVNAESPDHRIIYKYESLVV